MYLFFFSTECLLLSRALARSLSLSLSLAHARFLGFKMSTERDYYDIYVYLADVWYTLRPSLETLLMCVCASAYFYLFFSFGACRIPCVVYFSLFLFLHISLSLSLSRSHLFFYFFLGFRWKQVSEREMNEAVRKETITNCSWLLVLSLFLTPRCLRVLIASDHQSGLGLRCIVS